MSLTKKGLQKQASDKYVAAHAKNFDAEARIVWDEPDLGKKKQLAIETIVNQFQYPAKEKQFRDKINRATRGQDVDNVVTNIVLLAHGLKVL